MILSRPFLDHIELSYLKITSLLLQKNQINPKIAKKGAGDFLESLPFESFSDLDKKLHRFIAKYPWFNQLITEAHAYKDNSDKKEVLNKIESYIK